MTLPGLHLVCAQLSLLIDGPRGELLRKAVSRTAPAAAWARVVEGDQESEMTHRDIDRIVEAFGELADALAAVGLRLRDDGLYLTAWNRQGRTTIGNC